jgi:hypothetical protein
VFFLFFLLFLFFESRNRRCLPAAASETLPPHVSVNGNSEQKIASYFGFRERKSVLNRRKRPGPQKNAEFGRAEY